MRLKRKIDLFIAPFILSLALAVIFIPSYATGANITGDFTDPIFLREVRTMLSLDPDPGANAQIYESDVEDIEDVYVFGKGISSLNGIEHFTSLRNLDCSYNELVTIPALPVTLEWLMCEKNQLSSLPPLEDTVLTMLKCNENKLTTLPDLPVTLEELHCNKNSLIELPELLHLTNLWMLQCSINKLQGLPELPTSLTYLFCYENELKTLPNLKNVNRFDCEENKLTLIDLNPAITYQYVNVRDNYLADYSAVTGNNFTWDEIDYLFNPQYTDDDDDTGDTGDSTNNNTGGTTSTGSSSGASSPPPAPPAPWFEADRFGSSTQATQSWNTITNNVQNVAANETGAFNHIIATGRNVKIPTTVISSLQGTEATLMMNTGMGVTLGVSGGNIPAGLPAGSLNLSIKKDGLSAPKDIVKDLLDGTLANRQFAFETREDFGMVISTHLNFTPNNSGNYANLYRYNEETKAFEYLGSYQINERGQAMFGITGGADYLVTVSANRPGIPAMAYGANTYVVMPGDTLSRIAARHSMSLTQLLAFNPQITNANALRVGQQIRLR